MVLIGWQVGEWYQSFGRNLHALSEQAEGFDTGNDSCHPLPNFIGHEIQEFEFNQITLGIGGAFLQITTMLTQHRQAVVVGIRFLAIDEVADHTMDNQVGIAANGRRKVAIVFAIERVVSDFFWPVGRLLHAAQNRIVNGVTLGHVLRFFDHTFDFVPALKRIGFNAQLINKLRQFLNFGF